MVNYADDFVILSRGKAAEALAWTRDVMSKLGLTINETKTSLRDARAEDFDFLGYTFGQVYALHGEPYLGARPSAKSLGRIKAKIGDLLKPGIDERGRETGPLALPQRNRALPRLYNRSIGFKCGE